VALFDVNDAFDISFFDSILVNRIDEVVGDDGRVVRTTTQLATRAVVVPTTPNDLQRLPEEEYMLKSIELFTPFRLQGAAGLTADSSRQHPDEIIWHGSTFVVRLLDDYTPYGRGFVRAIAVSIDAVDPPPAAGPVATVADHGHA
jgi:hypothetical protein